MATAIPSVPIPGASGPVGPVRDALYYGFTVSAPAAAQFRLHAGATAAGVVLEEVTLAAGESSREFYPEPLRASGGVYFELISGAPVGSFRVA